MELRVCSRQLKKGEDIGLVVIDYMQLRASETN